MLCVDQGVCRLLALLAGCNRCTAAKCHQIIQIEWRAPRVKSFLGRLRLCITIVTFGENEVVHGVCPEPRGCTTALHSSRCSFEHCANPSRLLHWNLSRVVPPTRAQSIIASATLQIPCCETYHHHLSLKIAHFCLCVPCNQLARAL